MNFSIPEEARIVEGLRTLDCTIFCFNDVQKFLSDNSPSKKVSDRFISWLVVLRILSQRRQLWGTSLYLMVENYFDRCKTHFSKKPHDPLSTIPMNLESAIRPDIELAVPWLEQLLKEASIKKKYLNAPFLRLSRLYSMLVMETHDVSYTQNMYRFGVVTLAMTAVFSEKAKLPPDFAEAVAFYLVRQIISFVPLIRIKDHNAKLTSHFEQLDQIISNVAPMQSRAIKKANSSSIHFGIRYEILLFAVDNHNIIDILNIWDQIFCRLTQLEYVQCLTAAHVMQVRIPPETQDISGLISNWRSWDTVKLIKDANEILEHKRSFGESICLFFCPKISFLSGYEVKSELY